MQGHWPSDRGACCRKKKKGLILDMQNQPLCLTWLFNWLSDKRIESGSATVSLISQRDIKGVAADAPYLNMSSTTSDQTAFSSMPSS